jgi:hypothetical protein
MLAGYFPSSVRSGPGTTDFGTLTQSYPDALTKEEVAAKAGYEASGGVSTKPWAG